MATTSSRPPPAPRQQRGVKFTARGRPPQLRNPIRPASGDSAATGEHLPVTDPSTRGGSKSPLGGIVSGVSGRVTNDMPCPALGGKKLLDFPGPDLVETSPRIGPRTDAGPRARSLTLTVTEDRTHAD